MAALSFAHAAHGNPLHSIKQTPRHKQYSRSCHLSAGPAGEGRGSGEKGEAEKRRKRRWGLLSEMHSEARKLGRRVKESLSPKQKGDWKDLMLMSFSFAV
ncbi:hypothetical protein Cni_G26399 [Canna indica]|uniref:Uncharacterized protein n=1 Tax=Canna indica TaxID=4628 RepID=A0AAQ3L3P6_9LILI|nr:hypothetical protein Cni_G26399 [Canna indica]